ncbi:MAG: DUF4294 domain-containing protein [Bacteroidales bacterium]|jgi:hypothetical protein|nr:DUF4294 domain-containing protein [Bacteroidales bacterium]
MKKIVWIACLFLAGIAVVGQDNPYKGKLYPVYIEEDGDTLPLITLPNCIIIQFRANVSKKERDRYTKLVNNIIKVYPYARMAANKLQEYDVMLSQIPDPDERQKQMKIAEKQLVKQFSKQIENLTFSQGLILLKLVDRETGKTTYKIVKELRGSFRAFFYQAIARMFKFNLKDEYDPKGADKEIEKIVRLLETGEL